MTTLTDDLEVWDVPLHRKHRGIEEHTKRLPKDSNDQHIYPCHNQRGPLRVVGCKPFLNIPDVDPLMQQFIDGCCAGSQVARHDLRHSECRILRERGEKTGAESVKKGRRRSTQQ